MSQIKIRAALETAIKSLGGPLPVADILKSTAGTVAVFETMLPHGLVTGVSVYIDSHVGCVPAVFGSYQVLVVNSTMFSLKNASTGVALPLTTGGIGGTVECNLTAWDNVDFVPVVGVPYQRVNMLFARPENPTYGGEHIRELGYMQVTLYYPKNRGTKAQALRSEAIRSMFKRGETFIKDGITVNIPNTPEVVFGGPEEDTYSSIVKVPFWADVFA